jgi:plastocyanin
MEMRRAFRPVAAGFVLAFVLVACSDSGGTGGGGAYGAGGGAGASASATGAYGSTGSTGSSGGGRYDDGTGSDSSGQGGDAGGGPVAVSVTVANYSFSPGTITVKHGKTIELSNTNPQTPHTFTVTGTDIDVSLDPGSKSTVDIDLDPGRYPFECRFHGTTQGMTGTLVVK